MGDALLIVGQIAILSFVFGFSCYAGFITATRIIGSIKTTTKSELRLNFDLDLVRDAAKIFNEEIKRGE